VKGGEYPTQWLYHVPQDWVHLGGVNRVTLIEELGGDPSNVTMLLSQMQPKAEVEAKKAALEREAAME
jgi:hypothetical protein